MKVTIEGNQKEIADLILALSSQSEEIEVSLVEGVKRATGINS